MTWDPWAELERRQHITFARHPLPPATGGGVYARWTDGRAVVVVDDHLRPVEQAAALAHELMHDERGGGYPCAYDAPESWRAVVCAEEARVRRTAARRLVPPGELATYVERIIALDGAVTTHEIAEEFDTTEQTALVALADLRDRLHRETSPSGGWALP